MRGGLISPQDSYGSFSCEQDAVRPQSKLVESSEEEVEEGRAWGGRGTESGERSSPSLACLCPSVRAEQLQLCSTNCEEEPLFVTVNACLYTQSPLLTSNHWTSHSRMQIEVKVSIMDIKLCNTGETLKQGLKGNFIHGSEYTQRSTLNPFNLYIASKIVPEMQ